MACNTCKHLLINVVEDQTASVKEKEMKRLLRCCQLAAHIGSRTNVERDGRGPSRVAVSRQV